MDILAVIDFFESFYASFGFFIVFFGSLLETTPMGWLVPGGIMTALGGFFAYGNGGAFISTIIAGTAGMTITLLGGYYLGNKTGLRIAKRIGQENNAKRAELLLKKHGAMILTTSMLANLTRFWISYVAGVHKYDIKRFSTYAILASFTWTALLTTVGFIAGAERNQLESGLAKVGIVAWLFLFLAIGVIGWKIKQEYKDLKEEV